MSLVFEDIGRTTWEMDDRKEVMVSEPSRDRLLDGGLFDSIERLPRYSPPCTLAGLRLVSFISDGGSGVDSGWYD